MKTSLTTLIAENVDISEVIETVKQCHKTSKLPDIEVVRILWDVIMDVGLEKTNNKIQIWHCVKLIHGQNSLTVSIQL
jgi:hypothetical protein